jgi:prevent-host-death family protein
LADDKSRDNGNTDRNDGLRRAAMSRYSVTVAKNTLPSLIDRAASGEEVILTRRGKPVAELHPILAREARGSPATYEWLRARRAAESLIGITSVELLNSMYEERGT